MMVARLVGSAALLGGAIGALGAFASLVLTDRTLTPLVPILVTGSVLTGAIGGVVAGTSVAILYKRRGGGSSRKSNIILSLVGATVGGTAVYLLFFSRQDGQSPVWYIVPTAVVVGVVLGFILPVGSLAPVFIARRRTHRALIAFVLVAIVSLALVAAVTLWVIPSRIGGASLARDFSSLQRDDQADITFRTLATFLSVVIALVVVIAFQNRAAVFAGRRGTLAGVFLISGVSFTQAAWIAVSVSSPIMLLNQVVSPFEPALAIVGAVGWIEVILFLLHAASIVSRPAAKARNDAVSAASN